MTTKIFIRLSDSSATYKVRHEIDGIYTALLVSKSYSLQHQYPNKMILIRSGDLWSSDCLQKIIGEQIGAQIVAQERLGKLN